MGDILDPPARTDGLGGADGSDRRVRDVEGRLGGVAQQPGCGVTSVDIALDPDDGGDVRLSAGLGQPVGGIEDGDGAAFVAAADGPERCRDRGDELVMLVQDRLVALNLDDQGDTGLCRGLKCFFGSAAHRV